MQFSFAAIFLGLAAVSSAAIADVEGVRNVERSSLLLDTRQNRPQATGNCCIPNTSLKQDSCTDASGAAGKCVPGGPAACKSPSPHKRCFYYTCSFECPSWLTVSFCNATGGGALNCVANTSLACDNNVKERSGVLCRFRLPNGKLQDGVNQINNLGQAKVN